MLPPMGNMRQPRVAFNAALLREPYSGVEVMLHETACALATHGTLPYDIYTPRTGARPLPSSDRARIHAVVPPRPRLRRILWEQCALARLLRHSGAQVLHAPAYVAPLNVRCPVVLTVHDLHVFTHPHFCTFANRLHYRLLLPRSIRRAAAITVYSEHVRRTLVRRFPAAAGKTHVIPPGVPAPFLQSTTPAQREAVRRRLLLPPRFLLFVGDLVPRKNLPGVLKAFEQLHTQDRDLQLVLAGAYGGNRAPLSLPEVARAFHRAGLPVHCPGYVPLEYLPALYAMAEALVFPSFDEGFGLPALEAMACGCPVICSPGGAAEVCGEAALICDPASPVSITEAAQALLSNPALRCTKIAAGVQRTAQFRWENTVQALEALYGSISTAGR